MRSYATVDKVWDSCQPRRCRKRHAGEIAIWKKKVTHIGLPL